MKREPEYLYTGTKPPRYPALRKAFGWLVAFLLAPWIGIPVLHYWAMVGGFIRGLMGWA